jgi:hypothetical protein
MVVVRQGGRGLAGWGSRMTKYGWIVTLAFNLLISGSPASVAQSFGTAADGRPLVRIQAVDMDTCHRRCDFDRDTCVQVTRENCWNPLGNCRLPPEESEFGREALKACEDARRYCYRECERP